MPYLDTRHDYRHVLSSVIVRTFNDSVEPLSRSTASISPLNELGANQQSKQSVLIIYIGHQNHQEWNDYYYSIHLVWLIHGS
jgi:hypothetical protein